MANQFKILDYKKNAGHGWLPFDQFGFAAKETMVSISLGELNPALQIYPMAFVMAADSGLHLVAVMGLSENQNLYVNKKGQWLGGYVPGHYRSYPFALREAMFGEEKRIVLCFDHASGLFRENPDSEKNEKSFFNKDGRLEPLVQEVFDYLQKIAADRRLTHQALQALTKFELFEPWDLKSDDAPNDHTFLQGLHLHRINEKALKALDGNSLETLSQANALPLVYAQLFSMSRMEVLKQLQKQRQEPDSLHDPPPVNENLKLLESILSKKDEEDILRFD